MIKYRLFDNGKGVILTRQAFVHRGDLPLEFENASDEATVIAEAKDGTSYYRQLSGGKCYIPLDNIEGDVKITVALMGKTPVTRWSCEEIKIQRLEDGQVLVAPNDMNLPDKVIELYIENDTLRKDITGLTNKIAAIEQRLSDLLEGYDII